MEAKNTFWQFLVRWSEKNELIWWQQTVWKVIC